MKEKFYTAIIPVIALFLLSCECSNNTKLDHQRYSSNAASDSVAFETLTKNLLKWHETDNPSDFEPTTSNSDDSIYTGLDWKSHERRMEELSKTNFFSKTFLENYQEIALHLDKALKQNKTKYYIGELPPYGNGANEWCNCQDYPSDIWENLKITNIKNYNDSASFAWTWGDGSSYSVKTEKENGSWKIAHLDRFNIKYFTW